jgi:4-amino-4-deoxychorismate lyase
MSQLLETIKCLDGKLFNIEFHQARFENALKEYFGISTKTMLSKEISIPQFAINGFFRCRVTYSKQIDLVEFFPYQYRKIKSLKLVEDNDIDYHFKFKNREGLNQLFDLRGNCDDIIIVKNGFLTDSFVSNLIFFDGGKWWTPNTPLLPGTQRAKLLQEKKIFERRTTKNDIPKYERVGLINALNDFDEMQIVPIENIQF